MKKRVLLFIFVIISVIAYGQAVQQDVVYLKNGSIIRGTIIEMVPNQSVRIETADGSVFVYEMEQIERITKEEARTRVQPTISLNKTNLVVHPLGFLQFGPIVQVEFNTFDYMYGSAHLRWAGGGILMHAIMAAYDEDLGFNSFGFGVGNRYLFYSPEKSHAPYIGSMFDFSINYFSGIGYSGDYEGDSKTILFLVSGGYQWRFEKSSLNLGLMLGVANTLSSDWYYLDSPSTIYDGDTPVIFIGMLELSFAFKLK